MICIQQSNGPIEKFIFMFNSSAEVNYSNQMGQGTMSQAIVEQYLSGLLHKLNSAAKLLPSNLQGILYGLSIFIF